MAKTSEFVPSSTLSFAIRDPAVLSKSCIRLIDVYQVHLSPRKGFSCAFHALHGGPSCSRAVREALVIDGLIGGWRALRSRARLCRDAAIVLQSEERPPARTGGERPDSEAEPDQGRQGKKKRKKGSCFWSSVREVAECLPYWG